MTDSHWQTDMTQNYARSMFVCVCLSVCVHACETETMFLLTLHINSNGKLKNVLLFLTGESVYVWGEVW